MEQEKGSRVSVDSLLSVVSSKPTEPGKIHELSLVDQAMSPYTIHLVFYYRSNPFSHGPMPTDLDNLRVSLSRTLDEYPVVTGRLTRGPHGRWLVKCNDAGVRMVQATVSCPLDEWLGSADASEERDLTVWEDMPADPCFWSPFRIQINNFKCGGLAVGLSCTHMHADITSAAALMKSWAEVHRAQPLTNPPIFHQLPRSPSSVPANANVGYSPKLGTATLKFSAPAIERLLSQVRSQCPNATPFDALAALFWSQQLQGSKPHNRSLCVCVDSREKELEPRGHFGNGFIFSLVSADEEEQSAELGQLVDCIHRHVAGLGGDGDFWSGTYSPHLTCVDFEGSTMYDVEFDKGEGPVHVSCRVGNLDGKGLIVVMPSPGGGRTVTAVLPEEQIAVLCQDGPIRELHPTFLLSSPS
ncbi:HXXXD-type acyl-transferase family protein [Striga hermonthica]|uniref:HXXXD-type acyl-transferase family protein n=1 Tax=Striga hermonthica TaxID=68872 RepID=A0A9N7NE29_STRHE|nr:HXXXD-type acyl-transferase family protein [Striga hermonthica]